MKTFGFVPAVAAALALCAVAGAAASFPPSIYPQPAKFPRWGLPNGCASLSGVRTPGRRAAAEALPTLARFGRVSREADFRLSDRALWPLVRQSWSHGAPSRRPFRRSDVVRSGPGSRSPYAGLIRRNCGRAILARSTWFAVCGAGAGMACGPATTAHYLLIDRRGRWLVWFLYP
jgi:hypothetical protein